MSALGPRPVEPGRKRALQPMHSFHQIRPRRFQREMEVIAHQSKRVQLPPRLLARLKQTPLERLRGRRQFKHVAPVVSAVNDVVNRAFVLDSRFSRHDLPLPFSSSLFKPKSKK